MLDIEIRNISRVFDGHSRSAQPVRAVDDVSLNISRGELFFLLGPSGCGKTTLLRMLAGFIEPTGGQIFFNGSDVTDIPAEKRNLAMVFQNYALWPHMTVGANVEYGPKMKGLKKDARREVAAEMLGMVDMADLVDRKPTQLSGGQAQRVALARALAARPDGLLMDEPLSNLDAALRAKMRGEIRRIVKSSGATAVYVTHDQIEALSMADRMAVMSEGKIIQVGTPAEVYRRPVNRFVADFMGEANFMDAAKISDTDSQILLDTPLGKIAASTKSQNGNFKNLSDKLSCCIRPESFEILDGDASGPNVFKAFCIENVLLGATRRYVFKLDNEFTVVVVGLSGRARVETGSLNSLEVNPDSVIVLSR